MPAPQPTTTTDIRPAVPADDPLDGASHAADDIRGLGRDVAQLNARIARYAEYRRDRDRRLQANIRRSGQMVQPPSRVRYGVLLASAILFDVLTAILAAIEAGVITAIVTVLVMLFIITPAWWFWSRLLIGNHAKELGTHRKRLEGDVAQAKQTLGLMRQRYARLASVAGRSPAFRRVTASVVSKTLRLTRSSGKIAKSLGRVGKFFKSPGARIGGNIIPWIKVIPWYVLGVVFTYKDHKREYELCRELQFDLTEALRATNEGEDGLFMEQAGLLARGVVSSRSEDRQQAPATQAQPERPVRTPRSTSDVVPSSVVAPIPA